MKRFWFGVLTLVLTAPCYADNTSVATRLKEAGIIRFHTDYDGYDALNLESSNITNLSLLEGLQVSALDLSCTDATNLAPIKTLPLKKLGLAYSDISDLSVLEGMQLEHLDLLNCDNITDLSPLANMPLQYLRMVDVPVNDLSPLESTQLKSLNANGSSVSNLYPLKNLPLTHLYLMGTDVDDLSVLTNLPLEHLELPRPVDPEKVEILKTIKTLQRINSTSAEDFWDYMSPKILDEAYFAKLDVPSDSPYATNIQRVIDAFVEMKSSMKWPECIEIALKGEQLQRIPELLSENTTLFGEIADTLQLTLHPGKLVDSWDSENPPLQLVSNNMLAVDFGLLFERYHPISDTAFDVNKYLEILPNLRLREDYVLDYVY